MSLPFNRLLNDNDRLLFDSLIKEMWKYCPQTMNRKLDRANVQQAFVLDSVLHFMKDDFSEILSVGCFEDTAYESLLKQDKTIIGIDPKINTDLHTFALHNISKGKKYDIIFSTSVIEHVKNDEEFLEDICNLLSLGGMGILTMDFNNNYKPGDKLPDTDIRFYTKYDLKIRLTNILKKNNCWLVDEPNWNGEPDFIYGDCKYNFATFVFKKNL